jgi:hypothetical protein
VINVHVSRHRFCILLNTDGSAWEAAVGKPTSAFYNCSKRFPAVQTVNETNIHLIFAREFRIHFRSRNAYLAQVVIPRPLRRESRNRSLASALLVDELIIGQVFLRFLRFSSVTITVPVLHNYSSITDDIQ